MIAARGLSARFGATLAVDGVSFAVAAGEAFGIVGESGSGKSTVLRVIAGLHADWSGGIEIDGVAQSPRRLRPGGAAQMVFQDPYGSLSPRLSIGQIVGEGLEVHGLAPGPAERRAAIAAALTEVGLDPETQDRYPHEFSGGQRQRVAVARALVLKPRFVVLDEPTSALDVSVQAQIVTLLRELQARHRLAYLFISHDLAVVRALADELVVMKDGNVVEAGPVERVFSAPKSSYTRALMAAAFDLEVAKG